jgi:iron(III) transport system substrate-binding protein
MNLSRKRIQFSAFALLFFLSGGSVWAQSESMDELYKKALKEGGTVNFYGTMAQINGDKIFPVFERRFPGLKINHIDATSEQMVARAIAEARGGRTIGDVLQINLDDTLRVYDQKLLVELPIPEAREYPEGMRGNFWVASDLDIIIGAWNTSLVKKEEEPKEFDDFADARWKGRLIADPTDVEVLIGLAKYKFKSDDKAVALMKKIAANNPEFHKGHSRMAELLSGGQAAACFTCYSQHFPGRIRKGAPVNYMLTEGIASIGAIAVFKNAPHPATALLFARWISSQEGQKAMAAGGRTPAHPKVEPMDKTRSEKIYPISAADIQEYPKYDKLWKEIFKLR